MFLMFYLYAYTHVFITVCTVMEPLLIELLPVMPEDSCKTDFKSQESHFSGEVNIILRKSKWHIESPVWESLPVSSMGGMGNNTAGDGGLRRCGCFACSVLGVTVPKLGTVSFKTFSFTSVRSDRLHVVPQSILPPCKLSISYTGNITEFCFAVIVVYSLTAERKLSRTVLISVNLRELKGLSCKTPKIPTH